MAKHVLDGYKQKTVNGIKNKYITVNSTVNSYKEADKILDLMNDLDLSIEDVANTLATGLDDVKSFQFYKIIAQEYSYQRLIEAMKCTIDADKRGVIRVNKAVYFMAILRRWGLKVKFKKS